MITKGDVRESFRDLTVAASLKPAGRSGPPERSCSFRDLTVAASLKLSLLE